ncbi:uncharacterized protein LOC131605036 [Vicia villosa]|uniref:uncharacterized protein LOC131605036 n=1 Tax=Vicia villosa TaxID=3911 RepID=UPI00273C8827|nr:uncharacterized protein LOC131605036 [Vicia villosa]
MTKRTTKKTKASRKTKTSMKAKHSKQANEVHKTSQSNPSVQPDIREEETEASEAAKNKQLFNAVFHHGGEFVSINDGVMIYRGGVTTLVTNIHISTFTMVSVHRMLIGWGYKEGSYRAWTKVVEIDPNLFQIKRDGDCYDFAAYASTNEVDGEMFLEPDVIHVSVSVRNINVTIPVNEAPSLSGFMRASKNTKLEGDDVYVSDDLDSFDPDMSDDEKMPKFEKFRKEHFNKNYKFQWGMEFNSLDDFREAIREWSVLNGREITFVNNESYRVRVECMAKCGFLVLCSKVGHKHTYAIKTIMDKHTCARVLENRSASSSWVAKAVVKKMQTSDNVRICDIIQDMRQNFSIGITVGRAWKAKLIAKRIIEGDADKQYANLRRYEVELHRVNPGNNLSITVSRPNPSIQPRFGSFYFCFDGCKKGFINGCRPFVGVDGCHLKTKYGGQLLIVVGRDPNDQYFPLAFGVVETETRDIWKWFIDLLLEDIGQDKRFVFISNQQKGLVSVFEEMSDRIEHRLCLRHLDLMVGAAKAIYYQGWLTKMNQLKQVDLKAWAWLMGVNPKSWCKHAFTFYPKCDVLMNNIDESFNATILATRDKPILTMSEWIRKYLMNMCSTSALKLEKWPHKVMPICRKRLDNEVVMSDQWLPTWAMNEQFQVTHSFNTQEFIVDIAKRSCTCNFWELVGIPCRHAVAALGFRQQNPEDFVDDCYSRDTYKLCYGFPISPINGQEMWPEFGHNVQSYKSTTQDPNGLKRKKKVKTQPTPTPAGEDDTNPTPSTEDPVNPTDAGGTSQIDPTQPNDATDETDYFDGISDDIISTLPDISTSAVECTSKTLKKKGKEVNPMKRTSSERIKINWFKKPKPFNGFGSNSEQPMQLTGDEEGGTLTQEGTGSQPAKKKLKKK